MSIINVDSISDAAGTGSPSFPNGSTVTGQSVINGSSVVGDSTTSYNQFTVNGFHVGDGGNDYGITVNSFEPAITLLDRSTGGGSGQMRVQSDGAFWFLRDSTNDGTIGHNSNTTDSVIAKLQADGTVIATSFAGDGSALTGIEGITQTTGSAPYYGCRAWGKVSSDALVDGGNFASWASSTNTVTFTTAMPHANYSVNCNSGAYGATFARNMTTTSFEVVVVSSGGNVGNPQNFEFTVIC